MVGQESSKEYEWIIENTELTSYLAKTAIKSWLFTVSDDRDQWKYIMADLVEKYIGVKIEDPQSSQDGIVALHEWIGNGSDYITSGALIKHLKLANPDSQEDFRDHVAKIPIQEPQAQNEVARMITDLNLQEADVIAYMNSQV